jgi:hypothetical protein
MRFQSSIDLRAEILKMRLLQGPWKDGFKGNSEGAGFRFYFVSTALRSLVQDATVSRILAKYLDLCLRRADSETGLWDDAPNFNEDKTRVADADDSNAALFVLLATDFSRTVDGRAWWTKNVDQVKRVATVVLVENQLIGAGPASGLVSVFSKKRRFDDSKYDGLDRNGMKALQKDAYLMDSCEVYGALKALAGALEQNDPDRLRFAEAAEKVALGIGRLYDDSFGAFYVLAGEKGKLSSFYSGDLAFYPYRMAQCFPRLFDVPLFGKDTKKTEAAYQRAWKYARAQEKSWKGDLPYYLPTTPERDRFPVMSRGYIAALYGETQTAQTILNWYLKGLALYLDRQDMKYVNFASIEEMGYALRLQNLLSGKGAKQRPGS